MSENTPAPIESMDFVRAIITEDLNRGKVKGVVTRFPPEPNGYLHIGHAKSICLNFGIAKDFGGRCHLRFDDTNPAKEDVEYVDSIQEDVRWLGWDWGKNMFFASDYFDQLYEFAVELIKKGRAYVCDLTQEEVRKYRGTLTEAGKESPNRNRPIAENLDLFERMKAGEFADGSMVLRAKIDMDSPNINMRDPAIYRIRRVSHHRTGDKWCIYPMYDFTHCLSDALEGITHSICTLEFENNRPLYDWVLENTTPPCHPQQIEFARLNLTYIVMSKRLLLELVNQKLVSGWDDPRMPTICGLRRRGYTPEAIRAFCSKIGVTKYNSLTNIALLEHCLRDDLNKRAHRVMAVLDPIKVVIENYPEGQTEQMTAVNNPENPADGTRELTFSKVVYIERDDFREDPPRKYFRLCPGGEVRLRYAYFIKCESVVKDANGEIVELRCSYDPNTKGGSSTDGRKVKGTIHWVSEATAVKAEARLYDRLFTVENPAEMKGKDYKDFLNPDSLRVASCLAEPYLASAKAGSLFQFERVGYFRVDETSTPEKPVFNRSVTLRDTWAKIEQKIED